MGKKLSIILLATLSVLIITGCQKNKKDDENLSEIEKKVENSTAEEQGDFIVKDLKITEQGAENVVTGTVTNKATEAKSITIELKFTNHETAMLYGIANVDVDNLQSGETKAFSLTIMGDYSNVDTFEVVVNEKQGETAPVESIESPVLEDPQ